MRWKLAVLADLVEAQQLQESASSITVAIKVAVRPMSRVKGTSSEAATARQPSSRKISRNQRTITTRRQAAKVAVRTPSYLRTYRKTREACAEWANKAPNVTVTWTEAKITREEIIIPTTRVRRMIGCRLGPQPLIQQNWQSQASLMPFPTMEGRREEVAMVKRSCIRAKW